jgi:hypothetical protein
MSLRAVGGRKCLSAHCLDGTAAAPYEAAWCRSNRAFKSTFRAAGPALCCHAIMACCERLRSRCKGRREVGARQRDVAWTSAVLWISQACHSGAMAKLPRTARAIAGPRAFNGLCDDEGMPLICPTCQVLPPKASVPAIAWYFAWGCFRYFAWGATAGWRQGAGSSATGVLMSPRIIHIPRRQAAGVDA